MQPVAGDWRSKVKAARKAATSGSSEGDTAPAASTSNEDQDPAGKREKGSRKHVANGKASKASRPDLEALAQGLPAGWRPMWDKASSSVYYGNLATKVCLCQPHIHTPIL